MIRASAERVTVKLLPVASFNVPCHQAVSRRLRMGQRSPVADPLLEMSELQQPPADLIAFQRARLEVQAGRVFG